MDIAVAGSAAVVAIGEWRFQRARLAIASVAPTPVFCEAASQWLVGQTVNEQTIRRASELCQEAARPITDMRGTAAQRVHLVGVDETRASHGDQPARACYRRSVGSVETRKIHVRCRINDSVVEFLCEPRQSLLECLRDVVGLTGSKRAAMTGTAAPVPSSSMGASLTPVASWEPRHVRRALRPSRAWRRSAGCIRSRRPSWRRPHSSVASAHRGSSWPRRLSWTASRGQRASDSPLAGRQPLSLYGIR